MQLYLFLKNKRKLHNNKRHCILTCKSFETLAEEHENWVKIDFINSDYDHISDSKMIFLNRFNKLIRMNKDKTLMPHGIRWAFYSKN